MSSIVLDLQNEVTKPDCDIVNVLRKAHLIATKLNLSEFEKWISCELYGYKNVEAIPYYREVRGVLKAYNPYYGWIPAMISDMELENSICNKRVPNSISEILTLCSKGEKVLFSEFTGEQLDFLNRIFISPLPMKYALHLSAAAVGDIIEKVKNTVMEWTIKLEAEGILGEGMQFNSTEREAAKQIPQTINNYYGNANVFHAPVDCSAVIAGDDTSVAFTYEKAKEVSSAIETALESERLTEENEEIALEILSEIKDKISQQKKPRVIKSALIGFKDFLIGVGASATVAVIDAKLKGLI